MKLNHTLGCALLPSILAGLAIWLAIEHQARLERTRAHQTLEQQLQQMAALAALNEQLSNRLTRLNAAKPLSSGQLLELLRLRAEVSVQNRLQPELEKAREENRQVHAVLERCLETLTETNAKATADYWPQGTWTNSGYGNPEAALQTVLWAGYNGDLTNFVASVADEARKDLTNWLGGKSEAETSIRLAEEMYGLQSVQILGREAPDDNTVVLTVELENQDDFQTIGMVMKKTNGEWKFAGPQQ